MTIIHFPPQPTPLDSPRWYRLDITKDDAPCCAELVDELGRPVIGWCSPACVRRPRLLVPAGGADLEPEDGDC